MLHAPHMSAHSDEDCGKPSEQKRIAVDVKKVIDGEDNDTDDDKRDARIFQYFFHIFLSFSAKLDQTFGFEVLKVIKFVKTIRSLKTRLWLTNKK